MAYDEVLADRVRASPDAVLDAAAGEIVKKGMFGGNAFMVNTHMACGILGDDLLDDDVLDRWIAIAVDVAEAQPPKERKR